MRTFNNEGVKRLMLFAAVAAAVAQGATVERVIKPPRFTRGNTSILPVQPIDQAAWLSHPDIKDEVAYPPMPRVVRFRCEFESDGSPLEFDVTGDERYYLTLDGEFVSRGPHRGTVENWMYQSYRAKLEPGKHVMEATVWRMPFRASPHAQLSYRLGFCLKAEGRYDAVLTTGKGAWTCGPIAAVKNIGKSGGAWGAGDGFEIRGSGIYEYTPGTWLKPAVVRKPLGGGSVHGARQPGWMLFPSQLPEQTEYRVRPGKFVDGGEMKFPLALGQYLADNRQIQKIILCLDDDEPGRIAARAIRSRLDAYEVVDNPPRRGKDYNELLQLTKGIAGRVKTRGGDAR